MDNTMEPRGAHQGRYKGGTASVYVSSMEQAVEFYTDKLGLALRVRIGNEWAELDAGGGFIIGLHPAQPDAAIAPGTPGAINIELSVPETADLEALVSELKRAGVLFDGPTAVYEHVRLATLRDPDRNVILLAQNIPA